MPLYVPCAAQVCKEFVSERSELLAVLAREHKLTTDALKLTGKGAFEEPSGVLPTLLAEGAPPPPAPHPTHLRPRVWPHAPW